LPRDGAATRDKILDVALALMLDRGYAGTSIDEVIAKAGLTKGAFFYHFKSKAELAQALIARFAEHDRREVGELMERAQSLSRDPLQQLLIFIGLQAEAMSKLDTVYPGCLYAAYCYQSGLLEPEHLREVENSMRYWREQLRAKLEEVLKQYSSRLPLNAESLADHLLVTYEGAFILSKTLNEPKLVAQQLLHFRNYLELLFEKRPAPQSSLKT
jgi:TetR/AcrR family transcriptional repressor of nem operon